MSEASGPGDPEVTRAQEAAKQRFTDERPTRDGVPEDPAADPTGGLQDDAAEDALTDDDARR